METVTLLKKTFGRDTQLDQLMCCWEIWISRWVFDYQMSFHVSSDDVTRGAFLWSSADVGE